MNSSYLLAQNDKKNTISDILQSNLKEKYPDDKVIFLKNQEHLLLNYDQKTSQWDINKLVTEKMLYLENAGEYAEKSIYYSSFDSIVAINARTLIPDASIPEGGSGIKEVTHIETKDVMSGGIFYSGHKEKEFVFPAIEAGAITELNYIETTNNPYLLGAFYFSSYAPILNAQFSVTFPKNIEITHKLLGEKANSIQFESSQKEGMTTYTWTAQNIDKIELEESAPNRTYFDTHLVIYINSIEKNGQKETVLQDVSGLYKWYSSLTKNINKTDNPELNNIVAEVIAGSNSEREKVQRIYQWVQNNIKYVAFEDGLGGFVPREAKDVCTKKYGDCKDMSSLLVEMLKIAKIPAHLTWIGTRDRPYLYSEVPTPIVDNHMIAATKIDGKFMFLDATGDYLPFGLPTSMIQGKEALIGTSPTTYELVKVPIIPKEQNTLSEKITLDIDPQNPRNIIGKGQATVTGYRKVFSEYAKLRVEGEDDNKFYNSFLKKGTNKFEVNKVTEEGFFDRSEKAVIDYDFVIPDYAKKVGSKLYINPFLVKKFQDKEIDIEERKYEKKVEYKYIDSYHVELNIPEGYEIHYLPKSSGFQQEAFGFNFSFEQKDHKIILVQETYINHLMLPKAQFSLWNEMIEQLRNSYQEVIVLKKIKK